jgi:hypothetical protein
MGAPAPGAKGHMQAHTGTHGGEAVRHATSPTAATHAIAGRDNATQSTPSCGQRQRRTKTAGRGHTMQDCGVTGGPQAGPHVRPTHTQPAADTQHDASTQLSIAHV